MSPDTLSWFEASLLGELGRSSSWLFPALETLHFLGLCILFGSLLVVDLRMLGYLRGFSIAFTYRFIPVALFGFSINLVTGIWFFCVDPFRYYPNIAFRVKMVLILIAGINALLFWFLEHRKLQSLPADSDTDLITKTIAVLSLGIWVMVIICGRMMPYLEY